MSERESLILFDQDVYNVQTGLADMFIQEKLFEFKHYYLLIMLKLGLYDERTNSIIYLSLIQVIVNLFWL